MKYGYKFNQNGALVQIVCNDNKQWYRRESAGGGFGNWVAIFPPSISCGVLHQTGIASIALSPLAKEPANVPQR
jgi:hypothetical protein